MNFHSPSLSRSEIRRAESSSHRSLIGFSFVITAAVAVLVMLASSNAHIARAATGQTQLVRLDGEREPLRPDIHRARVSRTHTDTRTRNPQSGKARVTLSRRVAATDDSTRDSQSITDSARRDRTRRSALSVRAALNRGNHSADGSHKLAAALPRVPNGTSLARVLHIAQLSLASPDGSIEALADANGDRVADSRTTFDRAGGAFDVTIGASGARYEAFSATESNARKIGVLAVALDTNGDFTRDTSSTFDLRATYDFRSAASVVAGTSRAGREFVIVSSSGYYNSTNTSDPNNESSPGVVLLVRDSVTNGFDTRLSRELVRVGSNQLENANSLALLPNGDLLIADFAANELRVIRDTNGDLLPDTLDPKPFYSYRFSNDAPLEVAANSRGVVFSHSVGNSTPLLAIYDDDADGYADVDEEAAVELSIDDNLFLHGLTVNREGDIFIIEDAMGDNDRVSDAGNLGTARVIVFTDVALNGVLNDASVFVDADASSLALTGLAFGTDPRLAPVATLTLTNSASMNGNATFGGLGTITGTSLIDDAAGATEAQAQAASVRVTMEGVDVPVLSFNSGRINIYVPPSSSGAASGTRSVVVRQAGVVRAAADVRLVSVRPGIFTGDMTGAGESRALLVSGMRYTASPFPATVNDEPSVIAVFGTGWRNAQVVTARVGGQRAQVEFAGATTFPGLDQINIRLPAGARGTLAVVVTADDVLSRTDAVVTVQ